MKILIVEDNPDHLDLIEDMLSSMPNRDVQIVCEGTLSGAEDRLGQETFDVCLCDLKLPDSSISNTIEWLSATSEKMPFVTLTSISSVELAEDLLSKGVQDYICKEELSSSALSRACRYAIERWKHQRQISEHNKDMKAFCYSLSHDFNDHISRIIGVSDGIKSEFERRYELTEKDEKWFSLLHRSSRSILELVSSLQSYLSIEHTQRAFEQISLSQMVQKVESSIKLSRKKDFTLNYDKATHWLMANPSLFHLMLQNLLSNSIKFCDKKPIITLSCSETEQDIIIVISDNGIGFDMSKADGLFRPFKRLGNSSNYSGTGLGLSIVHRIVEHHGGRIDVESSVGEGSTFTITLPK